jgi:cytochrome c-type biogenesis protein CcmF
LKNREDWVESARLAMVLSFPLISIAALTLIYLLVTGRYEVAFVYNVSSLSMPFYLRATALWGGQAGSLVFWSWLMSAFATAVMVRKWDRDREFLPWVIVVALVTLSFFVSLSIFFENPFSRWWQTATVGGAELVATDRDPSRAPATESGLLKLKAPCSSTLRFLSVQ